MTFRRKSSFFAQIKTLVIKNGIIFKLQDFIGIGERASSGRPRISVFASKSEKDKKDSPTNEIYGKGGGLELEDDGDSSSGPEDPQDLGSDMDEAFIGHRGEIQRKLMNND